MPDKDILDTRSFLRDIIRSLWLGVGLYIAATSINLIFFVQEKWSFLFDYILIPGMQLILIVSITQLYFLKINKHMDYIVVIAITLIVDVIILAINDKTMTLFLLLFPILISLYFFKTKILKFAFTAAIVSFVLIYIFSDTVRSNLKPSDSIFVIAIIIGGTYLINNLIKHSYQLVNELLFTTKEKQDLFSKTIQMERLTRIDPVTELYNHRSFHEHLGSIFRFDSPEQYIVHIAVLDIDNFKRVNDTYGHRAGDRVILEVASKIQSFVEGDDFPARYGGEEFAIISVGTPTNEFLKKIEAIRESIADTTFDDLEGNHVTISAGIQKLLPGMDKESLFEGADSALYEAKRTGKNKTVLKNGNVYTHEH